MIVNIHERAYQASIAEVAAVVATLASEDDRLWPDEEWPRMRFDHGLVPGARGGHGPVRYRVERVDPTDEVRFAFTGPRGFEGGHGFKVVKASESATVLRHELRLRPHGWARLTWPLFFRPMHDALLEEALDKAARDLNQPTANPHRRSIWVQLSRGAMKARRRLAKRNP